MWLDGIVGAACKNILQNRKAEIHVSVDVSAIELNVGIVVVVKCPHKNVGQFWVKLVIVLCEPSDFW